MFNLFKKRKSESEELLESIDKVINRFIKKGWPRATGDQKFELKMAFSFFAMFFLSTHFDNKLAGQFGFVSLINTSTGKKIGQSTILRLMDDRNPYLQNLFSLSMNEATTLYSCIFNCPLTLSTSEKFCFEFNVMDVISGIELLRNQVDSFNEYLEKHLLSN